MQFDTQLNSVSASLLVPDQAPTRFRWKIVALLTGISFVSYLERMNISIAAKFLMPEFSISQVQMGYVFSSFLLGYALFQIPAGLLGDRFGPRRVFALSAVIWGIATILTGMVGSPLLQTGLSAFTSLLVIRFLLGISQAPTYPVAARAVANWCPYSEHALAFSILAGGLSLGSAITPPLISALMVKLGWRESFYISAGFAFVLAMLWYYYASDTPAKSSRVNPSELALIDSDRPESASASADPVVAWWKLLLNADIILISLSYFLAWYALYIFVFWMYIYLVDSRGFSLLSGGVATSMPFVVAAFLTPAGGVFCNRLSSRLGRRRGCRWTVIICFLISALCLLAGAQAGNAYLAVAALSLGVGFAEGAEGAFWATTISLGGSRAGTACGILNTAGNLGGVVCTSLVPVLASHFGWTYAIASAPIALAIGGLIWIAIRD